MRSEEMRVEQSDRFNGYCVKTDGRSRATVLREYAPMLVNEDG